MENFIFCAVTGMKSKILILVGVYGVVVESNFGGKSKNDAIKETAIHCKRKFLPNTIPTIINVSTIASNCFVASMTFDGVGNVCKYEQLI